MYVKKWYFFNCAFLTLARQIRLTEISALNVITACSHVIMRFRDLHISALKFNPLSTGEQFGPVASQELV